MSVDYKLCLSWIESFFFSFFFNPTGQSTAQVGPSACWELSAGPTIVLLVAGRDPVLSLTFKGNVRLSYRSRRRKEKPGSFKVETVFFFSNFFYNKNCLMFPVVSFTLHADCQKYSF